MTTTTVWYRPTRSSSRLRSSGAGCDKPVLIRIDTNAGHGAGKPTAKRIAEAADILSFFFWNTGTDYRPVAE